MPTARWQLASGVIGGLLYTAGGFSDLTSAQPQNFEAYDIAADAWSEKAALPTGRTGPVTAVLGGKLFVVGGAVVNTSTGLMEVYEPATDSWAQGQPMPTARQGAGAGVLDGLLYVVGGYGTDYTDVVEVYDPVSSNWSQGPSLPVKQYTPAVAVMNGVLYVAGGVHLAPTGNLVYSSDLWSYTASTGWVQRRSMSTPRQGAAAAVLNGVLYVIGGRNDRGPAGSVQEVASVEAYDPVTGAWSSRTPMQSGRYLMTADVVNGFIIVAGGRRDTGQFPTVLSTVEKYEP